uniref:Neurotransmitter-gated ion-channel ligand-binding domain-containing protein n=1 Tax=Plectus sambesii TaxID=2011161 RepID=A0A914XL93_9BILA
MLVKIGINLISLLDVNEPQEYIKLAVSCDQRWHDDFLIWDPAKFNGTTSITVPADMVWIPDVTVVSTVLDPEYITEKEYQNVIIIFNGDVSLQFAYVLSNRCEMKTDNFPFDSQECVVKLSSWSFTINKMILEHIDGQRPIQNPNTEWDVFPYTNETTDSYYGSEYPFREIFYRIKIKRKSSYYVWVIITPTFIISALSIAGIFAPFSSTGDREEKVSLGLTTLLTLAVILSLVTGEMPRSTKLPLLG